MIPRILKILSLFILFLSITGTTAYLTLTWIIKSEDTVVVPDMIGKNVVVVLEMLTDLGLNTKIKGSQYNEDVPKNHVIYQEPDPGAEIKKGRDVRIILSKGMQTVIMPNLVGLSIRQGRLLLEENGLCVGQISNVYYQATVAKDEIISQVPAKGVPTQRGQCVHLLVSLGPRPRAYKMSSLEGLSVDEAVLLIEKSNLQVGRMRYDYRSGKPENSIIDQNPEAGYKVIAGTPVDLTINRKPGNKSGPAPDSEQFTGYVVHNLPAGFLKRHVKARLDSAGISTEIYNGFMDPGEELWLLVPTYQAATLFIYEDDHLVDTRVFGPR
jgi:beta-lactam-binding protein with PASTA domain